MNMTMMKSFLSILIYYGHWLDPQTFWVPYFPQFEWCLEYSYRLLFTVSSSVYIWIWQSNWPKNFTHRHSEFPIFHILNDMNDLRLFTFEFDTVIDPKPTPTDILSSLFSTFRMEYTDRLLSSETCLFTFGFDTAIDSKPIYLIFGNIF